MNITNASLGARRPFNCNSSSSYCGLDKNELPVCNSQSPTPSTGSLTTEKLSDDRSISKDKLNIIDIGYGNIVLDRRLKTRALFNNTQLHSEVTRLFESQNLNQTKTDPHEDLVTNDDFCNPSTEGLFVFTQAEEDIQLSLIESRSAHFEPRTFDAAPIIHLGRDSFCFTHKPNCHYSSHPEKLLQLCSAQHSSRCFCNCMSQIQIDKSFALEIQERDMCIDAYYIYKSLEERYSNNLYRASEDADFNDIVFRYESCLHFYRLLAEIDCEHSASLYLNLLEAEEANLGLPSVNPVGDCYNKENMDSCFGKADTFCCEDGAFSSPLKNSIDEIDMSRNDPKRWRRSYSKIFKNVRKLKFPNASLACVGPPGMFDNETIESPRQSSLQSLKKTGLSKRDIKIGFTRRREEQKGKEKSVYRGIGRRRTLNIPQIKWNKLVDDGLNCRVWCKIIPNSTQFLFRLEGVIQASVLDVIAVMAEVDFTTHWVPLVTFPFRLGLDSCQCIARNGRFDKVTFYDISMPWPMKNRIACVHGWMVDDLERNSTLTFNYRTLNRNDQNSASFPIEVESIPYGSRSESIMVNFDGGAAITPINESSVMLRMACLIDPKEKINSTLINFFSGKFMRLAFNSFRKQCMEVATKAAKQYIEAREADPWLYGFLKQRLDEVHRFRLYSLTYNDSKCSLLPRDNETVGCSSLENRKDKSWQKKNRREFGM